MAFILNPDHSISQPIANLIYTSFCIRVDSLKPWIDVSHVLAINLCINLRLSSETLYPFCKLYADGEDGLQDFSFIVFCVRLSSIYLRLYKIVFVR